MDSPQRWQWDTIAAGLDHPWALAFLPDGSFLVTERSGSLRRINRGGQLQPPIQGVPAVAAHGQGGLLDLVLDKDFDHNRRLYFCYSEPDGKQGLFGGRNRTALASAVLSDDYRRLQDVRLIFRQQPAVDSRQHFGCRIVQSGRQLFLTMGDRYSESRQAQKTDNHIGKVVRLNLDGTVPRDNPFVGQSGARPEIYSYGHRNSQGATLAPDGSLWMHEHGPQGGDEINVIHPGANYGWPLTSYGEQYGGGPIGAGKPTHPGTVQPRYYWLPSIAPSGMQFVSGTRYGTAWDGNLLVGSLKFGYLGRLVLDAGGRVSHEERIPVDERVRDVRQAPDGHIYILTDSDEGQLLRLRPPAQSAR
ncbi:MAG: PQQ-dependent sugar dehydrogenase [Lautropia sp.]|nr:PQQ-dependent sugar dehydrogenase [Lautropia sp.]